MGEIRANAFDPYQALRDLKPSTGGQVGATEENEDFSLFTSSGDTATEGESDSFESVLSKLIDKELQKTAEQEKSGNLIPGKVAPASASVPPLARDGFKKESSSWGLQT